MNTIHLDCRQMNSRQSAHAYLAQALSFPSWYGRNLDALFDLLCEAGPLRLVLEWPEALSVLGEYGEALLKTFWDAAASNTNLSVVIVKTPAPRQ